MAPISTTTLTVPQIKTIHKTPYPSIDPSSPPLNQSGRNVLVTGAASGIGFAIAKSYIQASATKLIIIGRRKDVLSNAVSQLITHAKELNSPTEVIGKSVDASDINAVANLWDDFKTEGVYIDVLVLNHAVPGPVIPILEGNLQEEWKVFEINVRSIIDFTQRFWRQGGDKKKYLVNLSTSALHNWWSDGTIIPTYGVTKASGLLVTQSIANDVASDKLQIVSFHPGGILTDAARAAGVSGDMYAWDAVELPGNLSVWASTDDAEFLHGRWIDGHWDIDEIKSKEFRDRLDGDKNFLRLGMFGLERFPDA